MSDRSNRWCKRRNESRLSEKRRNRKHEIANKPIQAIQKGPRTSLSERLIGDVRSWEYSNMKASYAHFAAFLRRHPAVAPMLAAVLVHLPGVFGTFVYDDVPLIPEHAELSRADFVGEIWARDYGLEFARQPKGFYRPVFMSAVFGIYSICGPTPIAFHLFSLLCFIAATVLVTLAAARAAPKNPGLAIFIGVLYALHPTRVEVVSLFMSLPDLLVEIAALVTFLILLREDERMPRRIPFRATAVCAALALTAGLTKESAFFYLAPLAVTAIVRSIWKHGAHAALPTLPVPVGTGLGLVAAFATRVLVGIHNPVSIVGSTMRLLDDRSLPALYTLVLSIRELVIPEPVVFWRQLPSSPSGAATVAVLLILVFLAAGWVVLLRARQAGGVLLLGWLGGNTLNLLLLTAGGYPYSQRYLAVAPALLLLCLAGHHVFHSLSRRIVFDKLRTLTGLRRLPAFVLALYLVLHGAYALSGVFQCWSPLGFFLAMHEASPRDVVPLGAVAQSLNDQAAPALQVETRVRQATALDAGHPQVPLLHNMVIKRYLADGSFTEALRFADWSLDLFPDDSDKTALRAVALASLGRYEQALAAIGQAMTARPDSAEYRLLQTQIQGNMQSEQAESTVPVKAAPSASPTVR